MTKRNYSAEACERAHEEAPMFALLAVPTILIAVVVAVPFYLLGSIGVMVYGRCTR